MILENFYFTRYCSDAVTVWRDIWWPLCWKFLAERDR